MIQIPSIKIPSVRVGSIVPASNIGAGGATPAPPTPITYLTQWKLMGNSEVHGTEIWSCGEYSEVDNKWHIRILPEGYGIVDIALDEPLRKVNDVADSIEFADDVATVARNIKSILLKNASWNKSATNTTDVYRWVSDSIITLVKRPDSNSQKANILCSDYSSVTANNNYSNIEGISVQTSGHVSLYNASYNQEGDKDALILSFGDAELLYTLATPTTETIQVPQIAEADSYTCVISQGSKAVSWSSFETE